jgi:ABC-2 type transport system ATP-binding protein
MAAALEATGITKRYSNHTALNGVSISIPEKTIYGLLGPNGAGKTTLIRIINQIINADQGNITVFGKQLHPDHIGIIGYLPEERGLYKKMKVGDQLVYLARLRGLSKADAITRIRFWLERFGIKDWWHKKVEDLSKGMAQKVQFISTVLHEPKLIILDEPFSGFDPVNAQLITKEILEFKEKGSTIIFSTHRMETVEDLCDHIALIDKSKKILEGSKKEVKQQFKTNTYVVEHKGKFNLNSKYELVSQHLKGDEHFESVVRMTSSATTNQLLMDLVAVTEVHGFFEKVPTMSEIFISLVKGNPHE